MSRFQKQHITQLKEKCPTLKKKECFQKCTIKQAISQNKQVMVKTEQERRKHWDKKKNPSGDSQKHKIIIKSPQAQKNLTAHSAFRNPSLHSWGQCHGMLKVPCAVSDGSSTKQTHVTRKEDRKNWGEKRNFN